MLIERALARPERAHNIFVFHPTARPTIPRGGYRALSGQSPISPRRLWVSSRHIRPGSFRVTPSTKRNSDFLFFSLPFSFFFFFFSSLEKWRFHSLPLSKRTPAARSIFTPICRMHRGAMYFVLRILFVRKNS